MKNPTEKMDQVYKYIIHKKEIQMSNEHESLCNFALKCKSKTMCTWIFFMYQIEENFKVDKTNY